MNELLTILRPFFLTLHVLSVVVGMGTATAADILFARYLRDWRISTKEADTLQTLSRVVLGATTCLFLTGIALTLRDVPAHLTSAPFLLKMTMVLVLCVNGVALHRWVTGHFVDLSLRSRTHGRSWLHRRRPLRHLAFALGAISVCSWYGAFFISMLKQEIWLQWSYVSLLAGYTACLAGAIALSQVLVTRLEQQSSRRARQ